jgi:hypothetical protein
MFVPLTSASCFELKVVQLAELSKPLAEAEAVGIANVCVSVVLVIVKSVPVDATAKSCVPDVSPLSEVNPVPPLITMLPLPRSDAPLTVLMFVPETNAACLLLKVVQSADVNAPLALAEAEGILKSIKYPKLGSVESSSSTVKEMSFPELIRTGSERGLLKSDWSCWKQYREVRNITAHTYNDSKAEAAFSIIPDFLIEAEYLLQKW